jgi:hypothetical protein
MVFSHYTYCRGEKSFPESKATSFAGTHIKQGLRLVSIAQIRENIGCKVIRYQELVKYVAELGYLNQHFNLLFRGQDKDYKDNKKRSKIYPSIFRPDSDKPLIRTITIQKRFERLRELRKQLRAYLRSIKWQSSLLAYPEHDYALIQHYEIHSTPLIDLTQSVRVAATFALRKGTSGYVFIFGMPHPQGSISHYVDQEMVLVKLQNVCPPNALRPHYQEGYLVGRLPFTQAKEAGDNLARRLIGKYFLDNSDGKFWNKNFQAIPEEALFPQKDPFSAGFKEILDK